IYANQGGFFDACQEGKLEKADAEWRKSDRQCDIEPYEHSFLLHKYIPQVLGPGYIPFTFVHFPACYAH
ncbi:MAG: hypothetical protein FWE42_03240, partial [Defluviitaleaceae bacterium]|nr:hypothetical protein [Defluviitaleaceae bacterium]